MNLSEETRQLILEEIASLEDALNELDKDLEDLRRNLAFYNRIGNAESAQALEAEISELGQSHDKITERLHDLCNQVED